MTILYLTLALSVAPATLYVSRRAQDAVPGAHGAVVHQGKTVPCFVCHEEWRPKLVYIYTYFFFKNAFRSCNVVNASYSLL